MPKVPGHIHNLGIHKEHAELRPGRCVMMPVVFGMGGRWDAAAQVQLTDGNQFYAVFPPIIPEPPL